MSDRPDEGNGRRNWRRRRAGTGQTVDVDGADLRLFFRGRSKQLGVVATFSILGGFAEAAFLVMITRIGFALAQGDDVVDIGRGVTAGLALAVVIALAAVAVRAGFATLAAWEAADLGATMAGDMRRALSNAYVESTFAAQHGERPGRLQELLTTFTGQGASLATSVTRAFKAGFSLAALLGAAFFVDARASIAVVGALVVLAVLLRPVRSLVKRRARQSATRGMVFATSLNEMSQIGLEMQVFGVQRQIAAELERLIWRSESARRRLLFVKDMLPIIYTGLAYAALVGALGAASTLGSADFAALGAVVIVMLRSLSYGQNLQRSVADINGALPFIGEYQTELRKFQDARAGDDGETVGSVGQIELRDVSFEYMPGKPVLSDLNLTIGPHEVIGVVGPSGSGKSTLVQLLLGLRAPTSGTVLVDGRDLRSLSRSEWVRKATFVPQQPLLIAGTVAHNIRFLRPDVSDEDVERASRLANLHDDVAGFPEGYEREVGEMGSHLSGGQRQRLVIARALVEDPDLLILDEPTSALDVRSEHLIRETIDQLRERMTIVVIAHRLSTVDDCDRIMVIQDGRLRGFGPPKELAKTSDFYREAIRLSGLK